MMTPNPQEEHERQPLFVVGNHHVESYGKPPLIDGDIRLPQQNESPFC